MPVTSYKKARSLKAADAAYIAGLVDGEGTVTLARKHRGENRQLAVSISSTERQLLEFVLTSTGVGKITNKRAYKSHHLCSYTYAVYNRQALDLLCQLQPYLQSYKARRTELILRRYLALTPRNGKYSDDLARKRRAFEEAVLAITAAAEIGAKSVKETQAQYRVA